MKLTYKLTELDRKKFIRDNLKQKKKPLIKILLFIFWTIMLFILSLNLFTKDYFMFTVYFGFVIFILSIPRIIKSQYLKKIDFEETRTIEINDYGIVTTNKSRQISYNFSEIKTVDLVNNYFVVIHFKLGDSIAIPDSAFDSDDEKIAFINQLKLKANIL